MPYDDTTTIEPFEPSGDRTALADKLDKSHFGLDQIDWFWRNFMSDDGSGLYDTLVEPLTGDFNRIAENGKAWDHVSTQFQSLSENITDNTHELISKHWTRGEASAAYHEYIEVNWAGALFLAEQISEYIGKGFEKISEWSIKLAEKAIDLLEKIVSRIIKLARKSVQVLGQIVGLVEWVVSGFEDFPYWSDVEEIIGIIQQVFSIHTKIEDLVESVKKYIEGARTLLDAFGSIPEVNSNQDLIQIATDMKSGKDDIEKAEKDFNKQKSELEGQLSDMDKTLKPDE